MNAGTIVQIRLHNQHLAGEQFTSFAQAVSWFGGVQSQDYSGAKWGVGQRIQNSSNQELENAFNNGEIVRTHVMRPTWHFVDPKDASWMLQLTGPNISRLMGTYNKKLELTDAVFKKAQQQFIKMLSGKNALTRQELKAGLTTIGIETDVQRLAHLVMQAELDQVIISGPLKGKQFTYMLFDDRVKKSQSLSREEALKELAKRYFQSHGPATVHDFTWWSGLAMMDSKNAIQMNNFNKVDLDNRVYYYTAEPKLTRQASSIFLLPNYDEYGIAYKNRELFIPKEIRERPLQFGALPYPHMIIKDGILIGMWKRVRKSKEMHVHTKFFDKQDERFSRLLKVAADKYSTFLSIPVVFD